MDHGSRDDGSLDQGRDPLVTHLQFFLSLIR